MARHAAADRITAPLRHIENVTVSKESGTALNPHYFWLTWEYTMHLECGHAQVRTRCCYPSKCGKIDPAPANLKPPLPERVRCADCTPVLSSGTPRQPKPAPVFDPVTGGLVAALCKTAPALQDFLLAWADRFGRYAPDKVQRSRAYGAVALAVIDVYARDTLNPHAQRVRAAVERWSADSAAGNQTAVRQAARRLYDTQNRDGSWYAHRGIIDAAKLTSPHPHNIRGALACPTWDTATRSAFYGKLRAIRAEADDAQFKGEIAALVALKLGQNPDSEYARLFEDNARRHFGEVDTLRTEADRVIQADWPVPGEQHVDLVLSMLSAYAKALAA